MKTQSPDTHPDIEKIQIEGYRRMTDREKMRRIRDLNRFAFGLALADVRRRYPHADEYECQMRAAARWLPADLMRRAFGWDPQEKGY